MLRYTDKKRIRSEELYRSEIQKELQKNGAGKRFWETLNSAFILWLLSTLLVGGITFLYSQWEKGREENRRNRDNEQSLRNERKSAIRKLDLEIASRLAALNNVIKFEKRTQQDITRGQRLLVLEGAAVSGYSANVVPEFVSRNFQSLLYELSSRIKDDAEATEEEKAEVERAYEKSKEFTYRHLFDLLAAQGAVNPITLDLARFTQELDLKLFDLQRWDKPLKILTETTGDFLSPVETSTH